MSTFSGDKSLECSKSILPCGGVPCDKSGYRCAKVDVSKLGCEIYKCVREDWEPGMPYDEVPEQSFIEKNKFTIVGVVCGIVALMIIGGLTYAILRYKRKQKRRLDLSMMTSKSPDHSIMTESNTSQVSPYQSFKNKSNTSHGKLKLVHNNFIDPEFCHKPNKMSVLVENSKV
ncbi:hypothetical protein CONCODRAFT_83785 [Conidiobolus coronatus NRRL 28638]|uniref:Uncharacterized protein n=1 Tax=Conidiobolus coronatus (strain ATCC 28846 / CBS 209.66 / NRRL 28638) TaxID=796925 RepID=A0A137PD46_CONC2|nr:hypothetical protein CONCODRAFT_83785 [Conidiobolus coronatus NRRL 28638]|eukprot:KXN72924.1 hypothetical protein CONCODRAFT_83785 [Conidiobolus coronatus NRRL 28638]